MTNDLIGMILAAGKGTRLGELGLTTPKALIQIRGKTLLEIIIEKYKQLGIDTVIINLHHLADKIKDYINSKNFFNIKIYFSEEKELLDTGGAIKQAQKYFTKNCHLFLQNCDIYTDLDYALFTKRHFTLNSAATLAIQARDTNRKLAFDKDLNLVGWLNTKNNKSKFIKEINYQTYGFSGIQIISPALVDFFRSYPELKFSLISAYLEAVKAGYTISGFNIGNVNWSDLGTIEAINALNF